ncbi:MAG: glycoside hydrolase family 31 protein [Sphaerochaetaceae bacterium]|jgi:alpha-glucosidase|nr:glycoside hydrolase family 31 protein [Sphaerochaetaceae bacterium]
MYFHKIDHPHNFRKIGLNSTPYVWNKQNLGANLFRITIDHPNWSDYSAVLDMPSTIPQRNLPPKADLFSLAIEKEKIIIGNTNTGATVLESHAKVPFGVCGEKWLFSIKSESETRFYGMGQKNIGFEKSGVKTKFWNTDVWADFSSHDIEHGSTDPMYASFPVLYVYHNGIWLGLMIPTPAPVFMNTGAREVIEGVKDHGINERFFYLGSTTGRADLVIAVGSSLKEVSTNLMRLLGYPSRPPLWSLGYHQSRWGYGTTADAIEIDKHLLANSVPCDAIWFDIDYMDGYRVFTLNSSNQNNLHHLQSQFSKHGRRLVAILDPGVKVDDYFVCQEGLEGGLFCLNSENLPFVGFVWPGASYFPDFSLEETRSWWAQHAQNLAEQGIDTFWIDMNDPSTGSIDTDEMLFQRGTVAHQPLHNYYSLGMAKATWKGLERAYPTKRPFILTRSGMLGSHAYGAIWTGDNVSNYHHLQKSIEMALSLSISTMAFVGNDVGGFGGDCNEELFIDWYRACFLFPFFRNHSSDGTRFQEPWAFDENTLIAVRHAIEMRYSFLPYLYTLMLQLAKTGEPLLRPMIYENYEERFKEETSQFFVGEALLHAPKLVAQEHGRIVEFTTSQWVCLYDGSIYHHSERQYIDYAHIPIPLFLKEGCFVPIAENSCIKRSSQDIDLSSPLFLLFPGSIERVEYVYNYDEGDGYENERSLTIQADIDGKDLHFIITADAPSSCRIAILGQDLVNIWVNGKKINVSSGTIPIASMQAQVITSEVINLNL